MPGIRFQGMQAGGHVVTMRLGATLIEDFHIGGTPASLNRNSYRHGERNRRCIAHGCPKRHSSCRTCSVSWRKPGQLPSGGSVAGRSLPTTRFSRFGFCSIVGTRKPSAQFHSIQPGEIFHGLVVAFHAAETVWELCQEKLLSIRTRARRIS